MDIKVIFFIFLHTYATGQRVFSAKFDTNKFERKMLALMRSLRYMLERPEQMNMDTTLGVSFAEANLRAALQHKNLMYLDYYQEDFLRNLSQLSEQTRNLLHAYERSPNKKMQELSEQINRPEIWIKPIVWKNLDLMVKPSPKSGLNVQETIELMFKGHPTEDESDSCFSDLINQCTFTDKCQDVIVNNVDSAAGYPLTHRLLIIQLMNALQCDTKISQSSSYFVYEFCSSILQDLVDIESTGFPNVAKDLASEQILLCGMEGYLEFVDEHYEQLLLDWQHPSGCYSGFGYSDNSRQGNKRVRRVASFTDFGCVNHATGLGAAALALLIRKDIEVMLRINSRN